MNKLDKLQNHSFTEHIRRLREFEVKPESNKTFGGLKRLMLAFVPDGASGDITHHKQEEEKAG